MSENNDHVDIMIGGRGFGISKELSLALKECCEDKIIIKES